MIRGKKNQWNNSRSERDDGIDQQRFLNSYYKYALYVQDSREMDEMRREMENINDSNGPSRDGKMQYMRETIHCMVIKIQMRHCRKKD